jgi:hypothetical protein
MQTDTLTKPEVVTNGRLRLFSLYADFAAAGRAKWATSQITRLAGEQWLSSTEMWNLNSLVTSDSIRKMITQDAANADVLVIAVSSLDRREPELVRWLDSLTIGKGNRPVAGLLIGLFGDEEHPAGELEWMVKQFMSCAQRTGRDFIWHWMGQEAMDDTSWLADHVANLLGRKLSVCIEQPVLSATAYL